MADKRISFSISDTAHKALRFLAADRNTTQQAVIEDLIMEAGAKWITADTDTRSTAEDVDARQ